MDNFIEKAPYLISYPLSIYLKEQEPFRKLYLIIDTFNQIIRYNGCIFLSEYLHDSGTDSKVNLAIQQLLRPSLGSWVNFI